MQPYALYGLLPHYSLGLEIVVAYAKALNSSTLTSSLLWVAKAAMHFIPGAFIPFVRAVRPAGQSAGQGKKQRPARKNLDGEYS